MARLHSSVGRVAGFWTSQPCMPSAKHFVNVRWIEFVVEHFPTLFLRRIAASCIPLLMVREWFTSRHNRLWRTDVARVHPPTTTVVLWYDARHYHICKNKLQLGVYKFRMVPGWCTIKARTPQASLCVSLRVSLCLSLCLSVFLCVPLCVVVCLSVRVSLCVSCCVSLRVSVSLCLSVCHWVCLSRQVCALQRQVVHDIASSAHSDKPLSALRIHHTKLTVIHSCCCGNTGTRKPPHQHVRMQCASIRTLRQQFSIIKTACSNT